MKNFIKKSLIIFIGLPIALLVRLIRPIILIRFGFFYGSRIGHLAFDVEYYLSEKEKSNSKSIDLFFISKPICNKYFVRLISRQLFVFAPISLAFYANKYFSDFQIHEFLPAITKDGVNDLNNYISSTDKHLYFTKKENYKGEKFLQDLGFKNSKKLVCLNIRDKAYLEKNFPNEDFSRGDYRFSDPVSYTKAINYLINNGFSVIRMGQVTESVMSFDGNFFDYSNSNKKSEFLDIWLMANCKFAISTSSGLDNICNIFRRPLALVNALPISHIPEWNSRTIFTPKTIICNKTGKKLSLSEMIQKNLIGYTKGINYIDKFKSSDCSIINNSEEEILYTTKEIIEKINSGWSFSEAQLSNKKLFWDLLSQWPEFKNNFNISNFPEIGSISDIYLEKNFESFLK